MKVRQEILEKINNPQSRTKIAMALGQGEQSIALVCRTNQPNSALTKWAAVKVISEELNVPMDQVLEESSLVPAQN